MHEFVIRIVNESWSEPVTEIDCALVVSKDVAHGSLDECACSKLQLLRSEKNATVRLGFRFSAEDVGQRRVAD